MKNPTISWLSFPRGNSAHLTKVLCAEQQTAIAMDKSASLQKIKALVEKYQIEEKAGTINSHNEEETKKDFILPLFEALGWKTTNSSEVSAEETISKRRVDYGFRINGIPKFFLEAKSLRENLDDPKFIQQAINYSWLKCCTWAILTNFETISIFNAEWKTDRIFQNHFRTVRCSEFAARFEELWLLSRESFEVGKLDEEAERLAKKTKRMRVDKQLWEDLSRFREMLSKNVAKLNQTKNLSEEDLDEAIQKILDRLIFVRNYEDRQLEERTLISNLREWESKGKGSLVRSLREVFSSFKETYNSEIFATSECDGLEVDNAVLHEIVEGLYYTKDTMGYYDFSAIDADILGNIYEQYLGHILRRTEKRAKLKGNQSHRKQQGIYYTPSYVVDYIVESTLGALLKNKKIDVRRIRVLDPACGSGSFLIKAFDFLYKNYEESDKGKQALLDFKTGIMFNMRVQILLNNIFGVDLDKQAVEITRLNILLRIAEKKQKLPLLRQNIKLGNSLSEDETVGPRSFVWNDEFEAIMKEGGFDVVMGNPPYLDSEEMVKSQPELRSAYSSTYSTARGNWDIFCIFLEKGMNLLKDGGYLGMIVPNKLLSADYAAQIRNFLEKYRVLAVRDYSSIPVFEASVYPVVIVMQKAAPLNNKLIAESMEPYTSGVRARNHREIQQKNLHTTQNTWAHIFGDSRKMIEKIQAQSVNLESVAEVSGAASVAEAYELKEIIEDLSSQKEYFKFINTGTVDRYASLWGVYKTKYIKSLYEKPVVSKEHLAAYSTKRYNQAKSTKIVIGGMNKRLEAYLDFGNYLAGKSTTVVLPSKIHPKVLLAILNSKLMTFFYKDSFKSLSLAGGFMRVGPLQIQKLPIRIFSMKLQEEIMGLVNKLVTLNERLNEIYFKESDENAKIQENAKKIDSRIDELVCHGYGLTPSENQIIEKSIR